MPEHDFQPPGIDPGKAFGALPPELPQRDAWPRVAQRLRQRQRVRRQLPWALAAAALLALALWLPRPMAPSTMPGESLVAGATATDELDRLKQSSAHLESLLRELQDEGEDAGAAMLQARLQDEIAGIDALLASSPTSPEIEHWLWSERVLRLQRLAGLSTTSQMLAAQAGPSSDSPIIY